MEHATQPPTRWNSTEVAKYLLPYLRFCDTKRNDQSTDEQLDALQQAAWKAFAACPDAYRQLYHVYAHADDKTYAAWFGNVDCDDALLDTAFSMIERALQTSPPATQEHSPADESAPFQKSTHQVPEQQARRHTASLEEDASFRALFVISRTQSDKETGQLRVRRLDLLVPFLELCRCRDDTERIEAEDRCRRALQVYQSDYDHALGQYHEQYPTADDAAVLLSETRLCMQLLEQMRSRLAYETDLAERREALEYERGGLGWFGKTRKREIDAALLDIQIEEIELKIADEEERLQTLSAPLLTRLEAMEGELADAPVTAFTRKKELRLAIKQARQALRELDEQSTLDDLIAQRDALLKKKK